MVRAKVAACLAGAGMLAGALAAQAAQEASLARAQSPSQTAISGPIACSSTPFGNAVPVLKDYEDMLLLWGSSRKSIDEYGIAKRLTSADPAKTGTLIQENPSHTSLLTNRTLRKAVRADLNGDGRDEVVEVLADGTDVNLAVYERIDGPPVSAQSISTWSYTEPVLPDTISIVAGDFDGGKTRKQEVAVSWKIASGSDAGKVHVVVLQGSGIAHFVQANNNTAGSFLTTNTALQYPRLVAGDFLAQGRDQMALVGYDETAGKISIDLLEFDNGTHPSSVTTALPFVGTSMRGANFAPYLGGGPGSAATWFFVDHDWNQAPAEGVNYYAMQADVQSQPVIEALEANGGDVADTAAAELVYTTMFVDPVEAKHVLGQRLLRFTTTRDVNNAITSVGLAPGSNSLFVDSSIMLTTVADPPPKFAVAVADTDTIAKKEIVTAIVGNDGAHAPNTGPMKWAARKAYVRNRADYTWQNIGLDGGKPIVEFKDQSHGDIVAWSWDFGDSSGPSTDAATRHIYNTTGTYSVKLTTTDSHSQQDFQTQTITVTGSTDPVPQYNATPPGWDLAINRTPLPGFSGDTTSAPTYLYSTHPGNTTIVKLAVGDMDEDGLPDIVVAVNNDGLSVDSHVLWRQADGSFGRTSQSDVTATGITNMDMVFSDFDGDSVTAVISNVSGACANVNDTSIFALVWMPPYFAVPQAQSGRYAGYGNSSSSSSSTENHSESYFSESLSLSLGVAVEDSIPVIAVKVEEAEAKVTVSGEYQSVTGETHGEENSYSVDESYSVGNDNLGTDEEALAVVQTANSNCFSYVMSNAAGIVPQSAMRACNPTSGKPNKTSKGAKYWNLTGTLQEPYHWIPAQRDWSSLALGRNVTAGSDPATPLTFIAGHTADKATDGRFAFLGDGSADDNNGGPADVESTASVNQPYLEIDLGFVREIHAIRVFPSANHLANSDTIAAPLDFGDAVVQLQGFRMYASVTPFVGSAPPTTADVTTVVPGGISTFVQDGGGEGVYRMWNIWTFDATGTNPLQARYLRLQNPGIAELRIAEIQVFGDTHTEPQYFPEGVCDKIAGDGVFKARVYDFVHRAYKTIQVRGDMVWNGGVDAGNNGVPNCADDPIVREGPIWASTFVSTGGSAMEWNLSSDNTKTDSTSHTEEWSGRVGAEIEVKTGADIMTVTGAAYEHTSGVSKENQTGRSVGTGFQLSGSVGAFADVAPYAYPCDYFPRPYNFTAKEYSNTGYEHNINVTDYVIRQQPNSAQPNVWQRETISAVCTDFSRDDGIFHDHFGGNDGNPFSI